jgi:hypothetical protein
MFHILLHFLVPGAIVAVFFRKNWQLAYAILVATMLVDLDHLLATPVYDAARCSIGFHPLHQPGLIAFYVALCVMPALPRLRLVGLGLCVHMALDAIDCQVTSGIWMSTLR